MMPAPIQPNQRVLTPEMKGPMTDALLASNIRPTMIGAATTPLMMALQYSAFMGSIDVKLKPVPVSYTHLTLPTIYSV